MAGPSPEATAPGGPIDQPGAAPYGGAGGWGGDTWPGQPGGPGGPGEPWYPGLPEQAPKKGLGTGAIIAIIAALVIVVGGGAAGAGYYLLNRGDGSSGPQPQAGGTPPAPQAPSSKAQPSAGPGFPVSYTDEQVGVTMKLPEGWQQSSTSIVPSVASATGTAKPYPCPYGPGGEEVTCFKGTVLTGVAPTNQKADTPQKRAFVAGFIVGGAGYAVPPEKLKADNYKVTHEEELTVDGKKAYRMRMTMDIPGSEVSAVLDTVVINKGGEWVYILFASDTVEGAPPTSVFDKVLQTVSVGG